MNPYHILVNELIAAAASFARLYISVAEEGGDKAGQSLDAQAASRNANKKMPLIDIGLFMAWLKCLQLGCAINGP